MPLDLERRERFRFYHLNSDEREKLIHLIKNFLDKRSEIILSIIYGSILHSSYFRDIDIAIYISDKVDYLNYKFELERAISDEIGYPVDVKVLNYAPPWFIKRVIEKGRVVIEKKPLFLVKLYKKALDEYSYFRGLENYNY